MERLSRRINPLAASLRRINARPAKAGAKIPAANIFFKRKKFFLCAPYRQTVNSLNHIS
jgi:hypothetical protein